MVEFEPETIPLREDEHGVLRMGTTRVAFDNIIYAFQEGSTPKSIADQYPTVPLADIYLVLAFYLKHPARVEEYLQHQQEKADAIQREMERRFPPHGIRERLHNIDTRQAPSQATNQGAIEVFISGKSKSYVHCHVYPLTLQRPHQCA